MRGCLLSWEKLSLSRIGSSIALAAEAQALKTLLQIQSKQLKASAVQMAWVWHTVHCGMACHSVVCRTFRMV